MDVETPLAADDTDALLEKIYQPEKPMEAEAPAPVTPAPEAPRTFKLKVRDQEFEKPEPEVLSLAQKGLDYEMNNRLLRQERELFEIKKKEFDGIDPDRFKELRQLDEYARQNPQFLEAVKAQYEKISTGKTEPTTTLSHPLLDELKTVKQELSEIKSWRDQQKTLKEDQELDTSIKDLKAKIPEINWDEKDQFGYTKEHELLKHISKNSFPSAKAAAMDLWGDKIIELREQKAAEKVAKEIQERSNKGFVLNKRLSSLNTYKPQVKSEESYDDVAARSIKELGLGG